MSVPMELDEPATEEVPLDLTVKKDVNGANKEAKAEGDGPEKLREGAPQPESNAQNSVKSTPLDLSAGRGALPLPPPPSANVAQRASVVVLSPKVQVVKSSPPPSPLKLKPQGNVYWSPDSSSPTMAAEPLAPLHGMYADAAAYRHMMSSAAVPEYNPFLPVLPTPSATQFHHQNNHIRHQIHMQQQQQIQMTQQLQLQLQIQQQRTREQQQIINKRTLQLQAEYGVLPLDPALMLSGSPVYAATSSPSSSESNHFPFGGYDCGFSKPAYGFGYPYYERMQLDGRVTGGAYGGLDISANRSDCPSPESTTTCTTTTDDHHLFHHHHQQQRDLDRDHRHRINAMDDMDVVDPEEVAAIYRQSDFLSFRHRYIESLGPPRNFEKMRRSNNNNNSSGSSNNNDDDHGLTHGQQQYDQSYVMKRQKNNEAAKRSRDAKRQKYIENQISVMYLTKKVSEMKDIKRRLLKANSNILAE